MILPPAGLQPQHDRSANFHPAFDAGPTFRSITPEARRRARRVLVVDDDREMAESLALCLACEGYEVRFACSGMEGLAKANDWLCDVVILDANMPEHDGFETAATMRTVIPNPDLVIIAFTGLDLSTVPQRAYGAGFDSYCQKGLPLNTLIDTIETVCATALP